MPDFHGACHCGSLRYSVIGEPLSVVNCHCGMCRSLNGGAFSSYVVIRQPDLVIDEKGSLRNYQVTESAEHQFCGICGTPIFNTNSKHPNLAMLYLGAVQPGTGLVPKINVWCESKLPWVDAIESIKSFPQAVGRQP